MAARTGWMVLITYVSMIVLRLSSPLRGPELLGCARQIASRGDFPETFKPYCHHFGNSLCFDCQALSAC